MQRWLVLTLLLAVAFVHWPPSEGGWIGAELVEHTRATGRADFSFDDDDFILSNESVRSLSAGVGAFAAPFPPSQAVRGLYRPLTNFSYALDYARAGYGARRYHETNVLLYALVVLLVYALARWYHPSSWFALGVALLFGLHPVHCDAVDSISGRSELLALLFSLVSLYTFLLYLRPMATPEVASQVRSQGRSPGWSALLLAVSSASYALACLSKETGVVLPGILVAHFALYGGVRAGVVGRRDLPRGLAVLAPFAVIGFSYLVVRIAVLGDFSPASGVLDGASPARRLHAMGLAYFKYLGLFIHPDILQVDFYYRPDFLRPSETRLQSLVGLLLAGATLATGLVLILRLSRALGRQRDAGAEARAERLRACLGAMAIFLCFFLPYSHLFKIGAVMAERFLFAPSLGLILLCAHGFDAALRRVVPIAKGRLAVGALVVLLLSLAGSVRSYQRASEWRDDLQLWLAAERDFPGDYRVYANISTAYMDRGMVEEAREPLAKALRLKPDEALLRRNRIRLNQMLEQRALPPQR